MAGTAAGTQLTEAHRRTGLAIRAATLRDLIAILSGFDVDDIDGSWARVVPAIMALIESRHGLTAQRAAAYYQAFRLAEQVAGLPTVRRATFDPANTRANLELVGPIQTKTSIGRSIRDPKDTAVVRLSGEVTRLVLKGGRDTLVQSVAADPQALGYARVTSSRPCHFCAMLAGRGAVYTEATVDFASHSHCACSSEPVYSRRAERPGRGQEFAQLWNESTAGTSGPEEARRAFRQAYEGRV